MDMNVLFAYISVYMSVFPQRPKEGTGYPGTKGRNGSELPCPSVLFKTKCS